MPGAAIRKIKHIEIDKNCEIIKKNYYQYCLENANAEEYKQFCKNKIKEIEEKIKILEKELKEFIKNNPDKDRYFNNV